MQLPAGPHAPFTHSPDAHSAPDAHPLPLGSVPRHTPATQSELALHWPSPAQEERQRPAPSHRPPPHSLAGSVPATAAVQAPALPGRLHASHGPAHALPQHTPSAQWPDAQSAALKQVAPSCRSGTQVPNEQWLPALQSESSRHGDSQLDIPLQVAAPHSPAGSVPAAYGVQPPTSPGTLHASQVPSHALSQHTPSTQWPDAQSAVVVQDRPLPFAPLHSVPCVQLPAGAHAPFTQRPDTHSAPEAHPLPLGSAPKQVVPTHVAPGSQPPAPQPERHPPAPVQTDAPHSLAGSVAAEKGTHVPSEPCALQASHGPVQEVPQQTPSVQWLLAQAASRVQPSPTASTGAQVPPLQYSPGLHAQSALQGAAHAPSPLQVAVPHCTSGSVPAA